MAQKKKLRSLCVHDGHFHADEVTACALLLLFDLVDKGKIIRTRDSDKIARSEYVCDVGGIYDSERKLFDHHQSDYRGCLSSAGMILLYLKEKGVIDADEYDFFNGSLVKGVDDHDNGRSTQESGVCTFSHVISNFCPIVYDASERELNRAFFKALEFTFGHLKRLHARYHYNLDCRKIIAEEMKKGRRYLFFSKPISWLDSFFALGGKDHPALFIVMPAGKHWKLRAIPPDYAHRMDVRVALPEEWAGLMDKELKRVSGINGAIFCHKGRFTSVWETKEDVLLALKKVFEKNAIQESVNL